MCKSVQFPFSFRVHPPSGEMRSRSQPAEVVAENIDILKGPILKQRTAVTSIPGQYTDKVLVKHCNFLTSATFAVSFRLALLAEHEPEIAQQTPPTTTYTRHRQPECFLFREWK